MTLIPFFLYLALLLFLGFRSRRAHASTEEFLLSSRSLSIPAFVATLVTTWYGGILGVGEFVFNYGISAWVVFGLPYYFFALLFAWFLAPKIRSSNTVSIPDMLYDSYGDKAGLLGSAFLLIMTSPAPYILMLAVLLQQLFHFSFAISVFTGALFSVIYVFWGGFRSVVQTDKLQFVLMFTGFVLLVFYLWDGPLALTDLPAHLDAGHRSLSGGLPWQQIVVWFLIASWTFIDPGFHQRCAAAKTPQIARKGILISIAFWFVFDMLTLISGLYAFALYPHIQPLNAYPFLAQHLLPPVWRGLFFTGLLAIIMSTIDSYTFLSALTFGRDMIWRFKKDTVLNKNIRWGLGLTALISIGMIFAMPSVVKMWYNLGSLFIPPLLFPLLSAYFPKMQLSASRTFFIMSSAFLLSLVWLLTGLWNGTADAPRFLFGIEPFFPGLVWSGLVYIVFRKRGKTGLPQ